LTVPRYSVSVDIAAPIDTVFGEISDLTRHPTWSADPLEIRSDADGAVELGKTYHSSAESKGETITAELRVTQLVPPNRFAFSVKDLTGDYVHEFRLGERDGTTHVDRNVTASLGLKERLLFMVVFRPIKLPNTKRAMSKLKEHCEASPS
jgi:uncharacterized protein YndB with AHSA1/START domain